MRRRQTPPQYGVGPVLHPRGGADRGVAGRVHRLVLLGESAALRIGVDGRAHLDPHDRRSDGRRLPRGPPPTLARRDPPRRIARDRSVRFGRLLGLRRHVAHLHVGDDRLRDRRRAVAALVGHVGRVRAHARRRRPDRRWPGSSRCSPKTSGTARRSSPTRTLARSARSRPGRRPSPRIASEELAPAPDDYRAYDEPAQQEAADTGEHARCTGGRCRRPDGGDRGRRRVGAAHARLVRAGPRGRAGASAGVLGARYPRSATSSTRAASRSSASVRAPGRWRSRIAATASSSAMRTAGSAISTI